MAEQKSSRVAQQEFQRPSWLEKARNPLAGAAAGAVAAFVFSPLDVIRTRLMVQKTTGVDKKYKGIFISARVIMKEEGMRGFYKGILPQLYALGPNWAVYFWTYEEAKKQLPAWGIQDGPLMYLIAAALGAIATDIATNPLWLVKTRLQTQVFSSAETPRYRSTLHAFKTVIREEGTTRSISPQGLQHAGFFALWNGLTPQLIGAIHVMIQFPLYEYLKRRLRAPGQKDNELSLPRLIMASGLSKAVASTSAYPHEVLRSKMQAQHSGRAGRYNSVLDVIRELWRNDGITGFYKGLGTNLIRTVPTAAVTLTTYEIIQRLLRKSN